MKKISVLLAFVAFSTIFVGCQKQAAVVEPSAIVASNSVNREYHSLADQFRAREDGIFYENLPEGYTPDPAFTGYSHVYLFVEDGGRVKHFIFEYDNPQAKESGGGTKCDRKSDWVEKPWGKTEVCVDGVGTRCKVTYSPDGSYTVSWC